MVELCGEHLLDPLDEGPRCLAAGGDLYTSLSRRAQDERETRALSHEVDELTWVQNTCRIGQHQSCRQSDEHGYRQL